MLKACKYCGKIHDSKFDCGRKPKRRYARRQDDISRFRSTQSWRDKSIAIRERDKYLCQCCIRGFPGTVRRLNGNKLSVHHVVPIEEDYDRRLDDDNLITLCAVHHDMAESGAIPREAILEIIQEQESPPGV